jgi:GTP cyclohydrolase I
MAARIANTIDTGLRPRGVAVVIQVAHIIELLHAVSISSVSI